VTCKNSECRAAKKYLLELIDAVSQAIKLLDAEMGTPSTTNRGQRIVAICNGLELAKDLARRYGLPKRKRAAAKTKGTT